MWEQFKVVRRNVHASAIANFPYFIASNVTLINLTLVAKANQDIYFFKQEQNFKGFSLYKNIKIYIFLNRDKNLRLLVYTKI